MHDMVKIGAIVFETVRRGSSVPRIWLNVKTNPTNIFIMNLSQVVMYLICESCK